MRATGSFYLGVATVYFFLTHLPRDGNKENPETPQACTDTGVPKGLTMGHLLQHEANTVETFLPKGGTEDVIQVHLSGIPPPFF